MAKIQSTLKIRKLPLQITKHLTSIPYEGRRIVVGIGFDSDIVSTIDLLHSLPIPKTSIFVGTIGYIA